MKITAIVILALLLVGCQDMERRAAFVDCLQRSIDPDHITGYEADADRIKACGEAVHNAFGEN